MMKGAIVGTGFWANYQIPAWQELEGVQIVAAYNRTVSKARDIATKFSIANVYDDVAIMLDIEKPSFVDIITDVDTHAEFTLLAAQKGIDVICQKPMAATLKNAEEMVQACKEAYNFISMKTFAGRRLLAR